MPSDLGGVSLLSRLEPSMVDELMRVGTQVHVRAGEWLFREGDDGDALYVVETGRLEVLADRNGDDVLVRVLVAGDAVGELALLCQAPRAASVRAVRDSELLCVSHDAFMQLFRTDGAFSVALLRSVGEKLRTTVAVGPGARRVARVFAVVPLDSSAPASDVAADLSQAIGRWGRVACLMPGAAGDEETEWCAQLDAREQDHDFVMLVAGGADHNNGWHEFCVRQADRVLGVVAEAPPRWADPRPTWDLVVCGRAAQLEAQRRWLELIQPRAHHQRREASTIDNERMARRLIGHSAGIVFSGGGARGLAHLGVLDVLADAGVWIDRVGGTSMGALVGALFAAGRTPRELTRLCRSELVERHPFRDYTWPRTALIRARRAEAMLERLFGTAQLEDLAIDCFCVSADLTTAEVVVQRRGPIVEAVGASMSLPGLAPPVRSGGRLLVDGGVLNNVPVDVMAATGEGPVIAVDVMTRLPVGTAGRLPSIIETLARASVIGAHHQAEARLSDAAAVIAPDVGTVGLLDFARIDEIVEAGRRAAQHAIEIGALDSLMRPNA